MMRLLHSTLLYMLLLMQGCVGEKCCCCGCVSELLLSFSYELNSQAVNLFETHIDRVTIYLFDSDGLYYGTYIDEGDHLVNDLVMSIALPEGDYSAVVYGGDMEGYFSGELNEQTNQLEELKVGVSELSNFYTELDSTMGDDEYLSANAEISHLYVGLAEGLHAQKRNDEVSIVELIKNTNDVTVSITGTSSFESTLSSHITSANGRHGYDNESHTEFGTHKYTPHSSVEGDNSAEHTIRVMRLTTSESAISYGRVVSRTDDDSTTLTISDSSSGSTIYSEDLVDLILSSPDYDSQEDLDREDSYSVEVAVVGSVGFAISVNGWVVNIIYPDM